MFGISAIIGEPEVNVVLPTVDTTDISYNVISEEVEVEGEVLTDGGGTISERGIYWSITNSTPDDNDNQEVSLDTTDVFYVIVNQPPPPSGTITFYARAYIQNEAGEALGPVTSININA